MSGPSATESQALLQRQGRSEKSRLMIASASIMFVTTLIHAFLGGPEILAPARASSLSPIVISVLSVVWHETTVPLAVMAVGTYWVAYYPNPPLEYVLIAIQLGFVLLFLGFGVTDLGGIWLMPQWILFTAASALMALARR